MNDFYSVHVVMGKTLRKKIERDAKKSKKSLAMTAREILAKHYGVKP